MEGYNPFKKTAIIRHKLSKPMQILQEKDLLHGTVLDFGCGHGEDVQILQDQYGIDIRGYDKYNNKYAIEDCLKQYYDVITCNYCFNVIPSLQEHENVLHTIESMADTIYISVRSDIKAIKDNWIFREEYDCWETNRGSYQRFYNEDEMIYKYFGEVEYIVNNANFKLFKLL